jgi:diguanylate cyclase (GGDEF)-like protein
MMTPDGPDRTQLNAAVLIWQSRYRLLFIVAIGTLTLVLKWTGVLSADSVLAHEVGASRALVGNAALLAAYFAFVALLSVRLRRTHAAGTWAVVTTIIADIVVFNGTVLLSTPTAWHERALILSMFTLQLTLLYFGWRAAAWNLAGVIAAYLGVVFVVWRVDGAQPIVESLWTLALFAAGMSVFLTLHADLGNRLANIVQIFDRAREGDFSMTFDDENSPDSGRTTVISAEYNRMRTQLTSVILTDQLTQCFNPRGFDQLSAREISRAARSDSALAMIAVDLDHFKEINDTYGHLVGDDVLREIGMVLRQTARLSDVVARTGGEEFAILAPDTDEEGATQFATRLLDAFRSHKFSTLGGRRVTASIGVAYAPARSEGVMRLLRIRADEALYVAKRGGRDRAELWRAGLS